MKRSEVNTALRCADAVLEDWRWSLPLWARWSPDAHAERPELAAFLQRHQMGWDVTDFGSGDFHACGLTLFCVRNGCQGDPDSVPYAEKLLFVGENQVTPWHRHHIKLEDIINRGGGVLIAHFRHADASATDTPINVYVDGEVAILAADEPLRLMPGQSVTIPRGLFHTFYAEAGGGMVLAGEVSQVNDDLTDNEFLEPVGRFSQIEEDEVALYPLWNEVSAGVLDEPPADT